MKFVLSALFLTSAISIAQAAPVPAGRADDFVDSIGVATHWGYLDTPYGNFERAAPLLGELGVRHVRDDLHPREHELWEKYGIKTTALFSPGDVAAQIERVKASRDFLAMIEGPNEVDIFETNSKYQGKVFPEGPRLYQNQLYAALKADAATASLPVIAPSTARADSNPKLGPLDAYDFLVMHPYAGGQMPSVSLESDINNNIQIARGLQSAGAVAKRIVVTESGYHTATRANKTIAGVQPGINEATGAKYFPRHFAIYWNAGIVRTFTYEFLNEFADEATNAEASFGLVRRDFTPKPAYSAVKNLISLLGEARWNAATKSWDKPAPEFSPRALDFTLSGDTRDVRSTLLQKANGTFILLLWREVSSYDTQTQTPIENAPARVTVSFPGEKVTVSALRISDNQAVESAPPQLKVPLLSQIPLMSSEQKAPLLGDIPIIGGLFRAKTSFTLDVPDEIVALQIVPALPPAGTIWDRVAPAPPTNLSATTTGTSALLNWQAAPDADVAGYFVSRLGQQLGRAQGTSFADEKLSGATGFPYEVRAYDRAGNVSAPATIVALTKSEFPDLVITKLGLMAGEDGIGQNARFEATIENRGNAATPPDITHGVAFFVDGEFLAWSDEFRGPLAPGQSVVVKSNSGPKGTATWKVAAGTHLLRAVADDVNRIRESDEGNNELEITLNPEVKAALDPNQRPEFRDVSREVYEQLRDLQKAGLFRAANTLVRNEHLGTVSDLNKLALDFTRYEAAVALARLQDAIPDLMSDDKAQRLRAIDAATAGASRKISSAKIEALDGEILSLRVEFTDELARLAMRNIGIETRTMVAPPRVPRVSLPGL